jgi:hypothetical protein
LLDLPAPALLDDSGVTADAGLDTWVVDVRPGDDATGMDSSVVDTALEVADVAIETQVRDVAADTTADVTPDQVSGDAGGIPCGLSGQTCESLLYPYCCETADDAGLPAWSCVASQQYCSAGYYIGCTNDSDCMNSMICCHYSSHMSCENPSGPSSTCPGGSVTQACDPNNSGECPGGQACTLRLQNMGLATPYWGCQ